MICLRLLVLSLLIFGTGGVGAQVAGSVGGGAAAPAKVTYHQDRPELEVRHYTITVGEDGQGQYHAELTPPKASAADAGLPALGPPVVERPIVLAATTTTKIFELARAADRFQGVCASKAKGIADTGNKVLTYAGPDGAGTCVYNFSEVKQVVALTDIFQGMETMLEIGRTLDFQHRFDRLGLDAEMILLGEMLQDHRAVGVETIAPTLQSIASDGELLQRVRIRAEKMLRQVNEAR